MFLFCLVFAMFCARLFICAFWSPAGKGLTSWLSFVVSSVSLSLSHWYPGSGVVLDCIDSWSLHHYLLSIDLVVSEKTVLIYWWDSSMRDLDWKIQGQPWPLELIHSNCLIRFNRSSKNYDWLQPYSQKQRFIFSNLDALGSKFDLDVK